MQISWLGLEGKSVIVTGAASGIGKAVAQEFLNCGANVAVCDLNPQTPEFEINENSGKMIYLHTNVCDAQNVKETVKRVCEEFGTVDVIVNNAGINIQSLLVDDKEEHSKLYYLRYKIEGEDGYAIVATTRPETIMGDTAMCINPNDTKNQHLR